MAEDLKRFVEDRPVHARRISQTERFWRWCKRNPGIALLCGALVVVLVGVTVASMLAAGHFNRLRSNEAEAARKERDSRHEAEREKRRADVTLADMYASRGLLAGERDAPAEAGLWFAAAAEQSVAAADPRRQQDNRLRARNWMRRATLPVAALSVSVNVHQLDFQRGGDLLLVRFGQDAATLWSWREGKRLPWAEKLVGVGSAQFSPDGTAVALGFLSGEAQIRKVADGDLLATIRHPGPIGALAFSPEGKSLAVASHGVRVWDVQGRAFLDPVWPHPQPVSALVFNRKGDRLITTCQDKRARVFAVGSGPPRQVPLYAPGAHVVPSSPALIDEDRTLVTVSGGSELTRWDLATGKPVGQPIRTRPYNLRGVTASPDGKWLATGGYYGPELHAADANQPPVLLNHTNLVLRFVFSPDSTMLLSVGWDTTARLWSLPHGRPLGPPLLHMTNEVSQCAWSGNARYVATAQNDGLVRVWQRPVDDPVIAQESGWGWRQRPRVSLDGRLVVPGLWHEAPYPYGTPNVRRLRVLATADGRPAGSDIALPGALVDSCVCGDHRGVAAALSRGEKGQLGVWDVATARARFEPIPLPGSPLSVAARPGGGHLAVLCATGDLLVVDDRTGKGVFTLRHQGWAASQTPDLSAQVGYTPDGKVLVSLGGGPTSAVNVYDADLGRSRFAPLRPSLGGSRFRSFTVSADSRLLATMAVGKNAAQVWDLATGRPLSEPLAHPGDFFGLFSVRFIPDGRHLLTGCADRQARYWDWQAGKLACPPLAHDDGLFDVAVTPNGRFALTVNRGRPALHAWDLTVGRRVAPPVRLGPTEGNLDHTLAITPDGRRALVSFAQSTTSSVMDLAVVDLDALLSPPPTSTADLALLAELATARRVELGDLSGLTTGQWLERWDRLREGEPDLARSFVTEPRPAADAGRPPSGATDTALLLKSAALQAWFGQDRELAATCERALQAAKDTQDPTTADRVAKVCSLRPVDARTHDAALVLARRAVALGEGHPYRAYFQMALGMAQYRSRDYPAADAALLAAARLGKDNYSVAVTTAFYQAMSWYRQGKEAEARRVAAEAVARMKPLPADEKDPLGADDSADDLILWMAYKEAKALIQFDATPPAKAGNDKK